MIEIVILTAIGVLSRIIPHPANMTAVGAVALFSGARLSVSKGLMVTLVTMMISDAIIGFHPHMWAVYTGMLLTVFIGRYLSRTQSSVQIGTGVIASSGIFFFITNASVWAFGTLYPHTLAGLIECFVRALPFLRNSVIGDMAYSFLFIYSYDFAVGYFVNNIRRAVFLEP